MKTLTRVQSNLAISAYGAAAKLATICAVSLMTIMAASQAKANYASLIMDATSGRVLHETNADLSRYPASLTKMMTLYLLFEALDSGTIAFDEELPVSEHAAWQPPTKLGLRAGQSISVETAILALITKSANDVAAAVAERLGGSESRFAWSMTAKAREIGMSRTTFVNASGLPDPDQVTTARDMAVLALALLHDFPHYYHYFSTDHFFYGGALQANHNHLLGSYEGMDGIKTGYTRASGFNLVASAIRDGRRLIGVVLGARSPANRSLIMASLLDQAFGGGDIMEVQDEAPAAPAQVRAASVAPTKIDVAALPRNASRAQSTLPARAARIATAAPSLRSIKMASLRVPVRAAAGKKTSSRFPSMMVRRDVSRTREVEARLRSEKILVAAKPAPKAQTFVSAKPTMAAKSPSPSRTIGGAKAKPSGGKLVKALSSAPDRSRLRVAEGERRRSS